jgi:conjugal transfer/entry exclusion protein
MAASVRIQKFRKAEKAGMAEMAERRKRRFDDLSTPYWRGLFFVTL